jgi:hypothetical protein
MEVKTSMLAIFVPSDNVVARIIGEDLIIVPLAAGIGDAEDELYTLNDTGKDIWQKLDGLRTLKDVVAELEVEYDAPQGEVEKDVLGIVQELTRMGILVEKSEA